MDEFSESGHIAKDVDQRIAMVRHFDSTGQLPFFQQIDSVASPKVSVRGRECVLLGSNSYIGLSTHPSVIAASVKATEEFGTGTTGSRLLNGTYSVHVALERQIADWLGHEEALVFTTGYQTNVGTIQGLRSGLSCRGGFPCSRVDPRRSAPEPGRRGQIRPQRSCFPGCCTEQSR